MNVSVKIPPTVPNQSRQPHTHASNARAQPCVSGNSQVWQVKPPETKRALDLFSGKGSVTQALEKNGFEVVSVDINPKFNPTHPVDILHWDYRQYRPGHFQVISASVPCNEYSRAKTVGVRKMEESDRLVQKTLEIVAYFQPRLWWLENPRTGFLTKRECVQDLPYVDLDYCQFSSWGYQKPTRFWGSDKLLQLDDRICDGTNYTNLVPGEKKHWERLGGYGMKTGTGEKWRVPENLVSYLLSVLKKTEKFPNFVREDYTVRIKFVKEIEKKFGVKADRDCFASAQNSRCPEFFSREKDALSQPWEGGQVMWVNPPWTLWPRVVEKIQKSGC
jgi:hypothetical protein